MHSENKREEENKAEYGSSEEEIYKITPDDIQVVTPEHSAVFKGIPELRTIKSPFDLTPNNPILKMLKIPGVIFCSTIGGWLVGKWSAKPFYLILIGHMVYAFYKRRIHQYKLSMDTILNQRHRLKSMDEYESVEWINYILRRFWFNVEAAISSEIHSTVNMVLKKNCPKFLKSLKLSEITLGTEPPVIERIKFIDQHEDRIIIEVDVAFVPLQDDSDLLESFNGYRTHWNTTIQLNAVVNNLISLPVLVRNFTFAASMRVEISLTKEIPFLKELSFQFLKMPEIDFVFIPLKICDFMDLPLLSSFCKNLANKQLSKMLVSPNAITVDLSGVNKYSGKRIGVVCVYVHNLTSHAEGQKHLTLSADGKRIGATKKKDGINPQFNECFYAIIKDTTATISLTLHQEENQFGSIFLRNLNKHNFSECINLCNTNSVSSLAVTTLFYQATDKYRESAIANFKILSVDNLQASGASERLLYNTYVILRIIQISNNECIEEFETKRIFASKNPQYNSSHECFIRDFNEYLLHLRIMDDKNDSEIGYVKIPLGDIHTQKGRFKLRGVESGELVIGFEMEYIDIHREDVAELICSEEDDTMSTQSKRSKNTEEKEENIKEENIKEEKIKEEIFEKEISEEIMLKTKEIATSKKDIVKKDVSMPGIKQINDLSEPVKHKKLSSFNPTDSVTKLPGSVPKLTETDKQTSTPFILPDISIGIHNLKKQSRKMIKFTRALQLNMATFLGKGSYYFVMETNNYITKTEAFNTKISTVVKPVVPLYEGKYKSDTSDKQSSDKQTENVSDINNNVGVEIDSHVVVRLFKITINGDILIGEEFIDLRAVSGDSATLVFDKIKITFLLSYAKLHKSKSKDHCYKFIQCRINALNNLVYSVKYNSVHWVTEIFERYLFGLSGGDKLKIGIVDETTLSREKGMVSVDLGRFKEHKGSSSITGDISLRTYGCDFKFMDNFKVGLLEIHVIKLHDVEPIDSGSVDPFVCIYLNKEQVYKTEVKKRNTNPEFNESLTVDCIKSIDKLGFTVYDYNRVHANEIMTFVELPLYNLVPGFSKHEIILSDIKTGLETKTRITVMFNWQKQ